MLLTSILLGSTLVMVLLLIVAAVVAFHKYGEYLEYQSVMQKNDECLWCKKRFIYTNSCLYAWYLNKRIPGIVLRAFRLPLVSVKKVDEFVKVKIKELYEYNVLVVDENGLMHTAAKEDLYPVKF